MVQVGVHLVQIELPIVPSEYWAMSRGLVDQANVAFILSNLVVVGIDMIDLIRLHHFTINRVHANTLTSFISAYFSYWTV